MRIVDRFAASRPLFSFEFFPPRNPEGWDALDAALAELSGLNPAFVSVTYGAGGSTRRKTVELVARIKRELGIEAMAHLTCVGHSAAEIGEILEQLREASVTNVLALRGDPPRGGEQFVRSAGGFAHADELVQYIRSMYDFCIGAAAYPEGHPETPDLEADLTNLQRKVDSGVDFLITQLFFDPGCYFRFVERALKKGIRVPIIPGVMPITGVSQIERFTEMCGASIPPSLKTRLDRVRADESAVAQIGIEWAVTQCSALLDGGAPGIHFYTLNRSHSTRCIFRSLAGQAQSAS